MASLLIGRPNSTIHAEQRRIAHAMDDEKQMNPTTGRRTTPREATTAVVSGKAATPVLGARPVKVG